MKYKVAVEETNIVYYIIEADSKDEAMDIACNEGECCSSIPKQEEPIWAEEI
tara:strand:- start:2475 stop:2630 length:156 start_codon:yes stop_codon:yes gene_type:complete